MSGIREFKRALRKQPTACPYCKGVGRSLHKGGSGAFQTVLDPEYKKLTPGATWKREFYVCAACLGDGSRATAMANLLRGDFNPQKKRFPCQPPA